MYEYTQIPHEMKNLKRFIGWDRREIMGADGEPKIQKLPYSLIDGKSKNWHNPDRWLCFNEIQDKSVNLGFVLTKEDHIVCIDLDHAARGSLVSALAQTVVKDFNGTYIEVSQSGQGLHIFCKGKIPANLNRSKDGIEMYHQNRFIALTGNTGGGKIFIPSNQLLDKSEEVLQLYTSWAEKGTVQERRNTVQEIASNTFNTFPYDLSPMQILKTMENTNVVARQLIQKGEYTGDHSRDDYIFLLLCRNYTGDNRIMMIALFLMTPLNRLGDKTKRSTDQKYLEYLNMTIDNVLRQTESNPFLWEQHLKRMHGCNI